MKFGFFLLPDTEKILLITSAEKFVPIFRDHTFALVRLGKKLVFEYPLAVSSYQTLVRPSNAFSMQPFMKPYQTLVTKRRFQFSICKMLLSNGKLKCKFTYQSLVTVSIFSFINTINQMYLPRFSKAYRHINVFITLGLLTNVW